MKVHFIISGTKPLPKSWAKFNWDMVTINIEKLEIYKNLPSYFTQGSGDNYYEPMFGLFGSYDIMENNGHYWWEYKMYIDTEIYNNTEKDRNTSSKNMSMFRHVDHFLKVFLPILREELIDNIISE